MGREGGYPVRGQPIPGGVRFVRTAYHYHGWDLVPYHYSVRRIALSEGAWAREPRGGYLYPTLQS